MNLIKKMFKKPKFELYVDKRFEWRFRLVAPNGKILLASEGYLSRQGAIKGINSIKKNASKARIVELVKIV